MAEENSNSDQPKEKANEKEIGEVTHFFKDLSVAVIKLSDDLEVGDKIQVKGATTDFEQEIESMQVNHKDIEKAGKGDAIGLKVKDRVRKGDKVYKK